jgi:HD-GYP domain-containing protein (c-di-GMP phosphodiesterase class II)/DNA-binding CsgD family transcriptional regulator
VESPGSPLRLAEVVAAISLATDLGMGQPLEQALRTCVLATALGERAELGPKELPVVYYTALLRYLGCTSEAHEMSALFGDEIAARAAYATIDPASSRQELAWLRSHVGAGAGTIRRGALLGTALAAGRRGTREIITASCEVARRLAERLGLPAEVQRALLEAYERWDGRGFPAGLAGDRICPAARLVAIARDIEVFHRTAGMEAAVEVVGARAGSAYDPALADVFGGGAAELLAALDTDSVWETALAAEPPPRQLLSEEGLDGACRAMADFADIKSPWTLGHSTGVAEFAEAAAWRLGMGSGEVTALRRAALVHDLGRVGVPNSVWEHPGPLAPEQLERVRLHPYLTERVLVRAPALAPLAPVAGRHHERLDGSGYHRGCGASDLSMPARVLAAADVYHALMEPRPHRPPHSEEQAAEIVRLDAAAGRLDAEAAGAVLEAGGHRGERIDRPRPAGLTDREIEVLRLLARGNTNRAIAHELSISVKTVGRHVEHIYEKSGCSTRASASLFASEHDLL